MASRKGRAARRKAAGNPNPANSNVVELFDKEKSHLVNVMADHLLVFPDLYLSVFIVGDEIEQRAFAPMFARSVCHRAKTMREADVVVFTGGPDVDPQLYGERPHKTTRCDEDRDNNDITAYFEAYGQGIPMFGVCRGAQFLHVMNGGKLYQDVENHQGTHKLFDPHTKECIERVSSVHHQAVIPSVGMQIVATAIGANCNRRALNPTVEITGSNIDVEAFFYPETLCFGVQGHPEYSGYNAYTKWCLEKLNEFFIINPDVEWDGSRRRLKKEILDQRDIRIKKQVKAAKKPQINAVGEQEKN